MAEASQEREPAPHPRAVAAVFETAFGGCLRDGPCEGALHRWRGSWPARRARGSRLLPAGTEALLAPQAGRWLPGAPRLGMEVVTACPCH